MNIASSAGTFALCHSDNGATTNQEITDCSGAPSADYMEMYPMEASAEEGDIVMPSDESVPTTNGQGNVPVLIKATDRNLAIGIVSVASQAGDFNSIGYNIRNQDNPKPLALKGRVRVKVSIENGSISTGDPIALSSTPGIGAKATTSGFIIGTALEESSSDGSILVFVNSAYWMPTPAETTPEETPSEDTSLFARILDYLKGIVLEVRGLVTDEVRTDKICVGDVCATEEQFRAVFGEGVGDPAPEVTTEPSLEPSDNPEVSPESSPEPTPEMTPEPTPEPSSEQTPEPEPEPTPEP
jgi:hypothetical protein